MPRLIQDEFTMLDISAQRKYQLRRERDGLCRLCGEPAETGFGYCVKHRREQLRRHRLWRVSQDNPQDLI